MKKDYKIDWKVIKGGDHRYLFEIDEFKDGLPAGVINKKLPDVGGTYAAANSMCNYIIVCPTIDLVKSISVDTNNIYPIFACYGNSSETDYRNYLCNIKKDYIKVALTYDKLKLFSSWINPEEFKLLIDEYHILLQSFDFREKAISSLFETIKLYNHVTFLSATPINPNFEVVELRNLPHYEISWNRVQKIVPHRIKTFGVLQSLCTLIKMFQDGNLNAPDVNGNISEVKELFIFINSVLSIKQVCESLKLKPEDVKICCSDRVTNKRLLDTYSIEDVSSANKKINFFTSKCFQGCNLFSNDGLIVICSDCNRKSMVIDLSNDLIQIAGRLRFNDLYQNKFRNTLIHIYNTNSYIQDDDEFEEFMNNLKDECDRITKLQESISDAEDRKLLMKYLKIEHSIMTKDDDWYKYSENKEMYFRYYHELKKMYKDGISIRNAYPDGMSVLQQKYIDEFNVKLEKISLKGFQESIVGFYKDENKEKYYCDFPEYEKYHKYLTLKEINSLHFNKQAIEDACDSKENLENALNDTIQEGFMTLSDIKEKMSENFKKYGIKIAPKAKMIESLKGYKFSKTKRTINNKPEHGYMIKKL